ncbi:MAG: hypothetical protein EOP61_01870, partial [Sphingomonadales bacterium]
MRSKQFQWQLITFFRILFGFHLLYSAGAYVFFGWVPAAFHNPASPAGHFMAELDKIHLYGVVKYVELVLGLLIIGNRLVPLAVAMELPITLMIAYLNLVIEGPLEPRHYYTGVQELFINGILLLGYGAYYRSVLTVDARPRWLGAPLGSGSMPTTENAAASSRRITAPMWLVFLGFMVAVVAASWFLGSAARRLPPRDWLP